MTVQFGGLDVMIGLAAEHMAKYLGEGPVQRFTQRKLDDLKDWSKTHRAVLGDELVTRLVDFANDATAVLRERVDAIHSLWLKEDDGRAWAMKLPAGSTRGVRSSTDESTIEHLTEQATELDRRIGQLTVDVLKLFEQRTAV